MTLIAEQAAAFNTVNKKEAFATIVASQDLGPDESTLALEAAEQAIQNNAHRLAAIAAINRGNVVLNEEFPR
jgi:ABC-type sugar transport system substrate-binding protein